MGISSELNVRLRDSMLRCGPFGNVNEVRALFADKRLEAWRYMVPEGSSERGRVMMLVAQLHDQWDVQGNNALVLLLLALGELAAPNSECHRELLALARALAQEVGGPEIPAPLGAARGELSSAEQRELAKAFLAIPSMADHASRNDIIHQLRDEIAGNISASPVANLHVLNIVKTVLQYENGIEELLEVLRFTEGNSRPMQQLEATVHRLLPTERPSVAGPPIDKEIPWKATRGDDQLEKIIGLQSTLVPISFLELGLLRARSVARVLLPRGLGSGFLIANNLLMTNHHVIPSPAVAQETLVQFNYQKTLDGLDASHEELALDPDEVFATSEADDWTVVRVQGNPNERWGAIPLAPADPKAEDRVNIIQHPAGSFKQISAYHNIVAYVGNGRVQYLTDTLPGSSGSPVFDQQWRLVALHHSGGDLPEPGSPSDQTFWRNEGIHINTVIAGLKAAGVEVG